MSPSRYDAIIIGGGFFGCCLALYLKDYMAKVLILEMGSDLMERASYANQARVHNGYHYPRSLLTALRSRVNFPRFVKDYRECIDSSFDNYYAVGKGFSKVTASQYKLFCKRIDALIRPAQQQIKSLFNPDLIEDVFLVKECVFDAVKLKSMVWSDLKNKKIEVWLNSKMLKAGPATDSSIEVVYCNSTNQLDRLNAKHVFNCTYSGLNRVLVNSNLPIIPLKHELTEMALVEVPESLKHLAITVMCGPFFSLMPFPARGLHTLSHVRYTPHHFWQDGDSSPYMDSNEYFSSVARKSNYIHILKDVQRYLPPIKGCRYVDSIWEVKTVLPQSELDDSRPILFKKDHGLPNFTCVMGGKIDNIYDVFDEIDCLRVEGRIG